MILGPSKQFNVKGRLLLFMANDSARLPVRVCPWTAFDDDNRESVAAAAATNEPSDDKQPRRKPVGPPLIAPLSVVCT